MYSILNSWNKDYYVDTDLGIYQLTSLCLEDRNFIEPQTGKYNNLVHHFKQT